MSVDNLWSTRGATKETLEIEEMDACGLNSMSDE